jgi:CRISPR-associated Csx10 family RAMP protein
MTGWKLKLFPETCVAVGGHTASWFADRATARDQDGVPIIPATAVKGALCIEARRLFPARPEVARLFSGGRLRFGNARLCGDAVHLYGSAKGKAGPGYQRRVGIAVSRKTRSVQHGRLFDWETTAQFVEGARFEAVIACLSTPDEKELKILEGLRNALGITGLGIGSGKSRGMGLFRVEFEQISGMPAPTASSLTPAPAGEYLVKLVPTEEFRSSRLKPRQFLMETADHVPGATFRGAVAAALGKADEGRFKRLFDQAEARFGPLYPAGGGFDASRPYPFSARTCKVYPGEYISTGAKGRMGGRSHGLHDILLHRLCRPGRPDPTCPECGRELKPRDGYFCPAGADFRRVQPSVHLATKLRLDRGRMAASSGDLYSYESNLPPPPGQRADRSFIGLLAGISEEDARAIAELGELYIGGARGRGFGRMRVEGLMPAPTPEPVEKRLDQLKAELRRQWPGFEQDTRVFFTLDFVSDLILPCGESLADILTRAVGDGMKLGPAFVREEYAGGYNAALGMPKDMMPAIAKGSCLVGSVSQNTADLAQKLESVEKHGLGLRRQEGYGRVVVCSSFHWEKALRSKED